MGKPKYTCGSLEIPKTFYSLGVDSSMNGLAAVMRKCRIKADEIVSENCGVFCVTTVLKEVALINKLDFQGVKKGVILRNRNKEESTFGYDMYRIRYIGSELRGWCEEIMGTEYAKAKNRFCAFEDYAYGAGKGKSRTQAVVQLGEFTGAMKQILLTEGCYLRSYTPTVIKRFSTGDGKAKKKAMREAAESIGFEIPESLFREDLKDLSGPGTDIVDAYLISELLETELLIRLGEVELSELESYQRSVFLANSQSNPVNILDRPFVKVSFDNLYEVQGFTS